MKNLWKTLLLASFLAMLGLIRYGTANAEEFKTPAFAKDNIKRVINGQLQDLAPILDKNSLVVYFGGLDEKTRADLEKILESNFGLKKANTLYEKPDYILFHFRKTPPTLDAGIARLNEILTKTPFTSPVFEFPEGKFALAGTIKIQWKKHYPEAEIKKIIQAFALEIVDYNQDTNTAVIRPTPKSGKNVFVWAILFDSENDFRVLSSHVEFVRVQSPIRAEVKIEAECMNNASAGNTVASGIFCYRLKFFRAPDIKVSFDDLSINTKLLRTWSPQGLPKNLRRFEGDRAYKTAVEKLATGEVVDTVEYKFRILRSGEFVLPLLRYYYNIAGNIEDNKNRLEGVIPEMQILVSPLSPKSQITVNGIPDVGSANGSEKNEKGMSKIFPWWLGIIGMGAGVFLVILALKSGRKPDEKVETPKEKALGLWKKYQGQVDAMNDGNRLKLLKRVLGLYCFDNEYKPLASANSSDWKERLKDVLPESLTVKTLEFVRDVENSRESQIDFNGLIREIFSREG